MQIVKESLSLENLPIQESVSVAVGSLCLRDLRATRDGDRKPGSGGSMRVSLYFTACLVSRRLSFCRRKNVSVYGKSSTDNPIARQGSLAIPRQCLVSTRLARRPAMPLSKNLPPKLRQFSQRGAKVSVCNFRQTAGFVCREAASSANIASGHTERQRGIGAC